ncbi:MAG: enoyl-CoA hydratase [Gemmatimonadetes bacterium]|nr:enoyl-CoA hydratase [Gemmatimonadota bacterium]
MGNRALVERRGAVAIVTINRPEARNAINAEVAAAMNRAFGELARDDTVRCVILTGAGDKAFSSGLDLKELARRGPALIPEVVFADTGWAGIGRRQFWKPLIAAVNGYAVAGGLELMLSCDFAIASDNAKLGCNEVTLGPIADAGACFRLPDWVPLPFAKEMILTGRMVDAHEAARVGLVNRVVGLAELLPTCLELAERIARNSPSSMQITKRLMAETRNVPESVAWSINDRCAEESYRTADFLEGPRAFAEKRSAKFHG